jgi:hypothetical protein
MNDSGRLNSPKMRKNIRDEILLFKAAEPDLSAKKILNKLEKLHPGSKYIPKVRAIQKHIRKNEKLLENSVPSDLDKPWSIGACEQANIPPDVISVLINWKWFRKDRDRKDRELTIREAKWIARLTPLARECVKKMAQESTERFAEISDATFESIITHWVVNYADKERMAELSGEKYTYLDTTEIDEFFFHDLQYFRGELGPISR